MGSRKDIYGDLLTKSDDDLNKLMIDISALRSDNTQISPGGFDIAIDRSFALSYKTILDILNIRKAERLVRETQKLAQITWGLAVATWVLAFATILMIFLAK